MSFIGFTVLNWLYGIVLAAVVELTILVFIVNGYRNTGKFYAVVSFFLNALYYDYWFVAIEEPTMMNFKLMGTSFLICLTHSLSVWQLSELFYKKLKDDKEKAVEYLCRSEAGPFPNKRSLEWAYFEGA